VDGLVDQLQQLRDEALAGEQMLQPAAALLERDSARLQRRQ
jgi:hypothetical protein